MKTKVEKATEINRFCRFWKEKGREKGQTQPFWLEILQKILEIEHPSEEIVFEKPVKIDGKTYFIDAYIPKTRVLIEQKSIGIDLFKKARQSDGKYRTPYEQAEHYDNNLISSEHARWIVVSNFNDFYVYDMDKRGSDPKRIELDNLEKEYYRFNFLVDPKSECLDKEVAVSVEAGNLVGELYEELLKQYEDPKSEKTLNSLNLLCVRLVFCLYAEDAEIFETHTSFHDYMVNFTPENSREALIKLFEVLNTPEDKRSSYLSEELLKFPFVNGGLFAETKTEIPKFNEKICNILLKKASENFDWSEISPTIFGAIFESTLNPETRRLGGMHYTSIETIHNVIGPLFLGELYNEFYKIKNIKVKREKKEKVLEFKKKLASLCFLDPACGSGNFLTETYIHLRKLENECIKILVGEKRQGELDVLGDDFKIQVSIDQFSGIEINDFAVSVAKAALWIAESQMMKKTQMILHRNLEFLPLKNNANIVFGNALEKNWESVIPVDKLNYIIGNPPFAGARVMTNKQKAEVLNVFGKSWKNVGNLDYVTCWYKKACDVMKGSNIRAAFVSTNSVSQGEIVPTLWKPLFESGCHFDFAHQSFCWDSKSSNMAHVHCVIIGFSMATSSKNKIIFSEDKEPIIAKNINGYLNDGDDLFIESRTNPICNVPEIGMGNQPIDDSNYLFSEDEKQEFIKKEPKSKTYFKKWYGAKEFINKKNRWCLWLGECPPNKIRSMPECYKRVEAVRKFRQSSKRKSTLKLADKPRNFQTENMPKSKYIVIPETSSENRRYIPIDFMDPNDLCSNALRLMPGADYYHFGILTSFVHMAWMRTVAGRLKSDYRYSIDLVYNNFPWPKITTQKKQAIEKTAKTILEIRKKYPDSSFADLYDPNTMPPDLLRAHIANDRVVMRAYGFSASLNETEIVTRLMKLYDKITKGE